MADLTQDKIRLLDRLYNLRGDESIITTSIQSKIDNIISEAEETERIKREHEGIKTDLESELKTFTNQATSFLETFSKFDNSSFKALNAVDIDLELGDIVSKLKEAQPRHEEHLSSKISDIKNEIINNEEKIKLLSTDRKEEEEKLQNAENVKSKLNNLLDDILVNENDSYNRGYIKKILNELEVFDEEETSELEFLILFPEKGLTEYVNNYKDREDKFIPIFDEENKEEKIIEINNYDITEEDSKEEKEEPVFEPVSEENEEEIEDEKDSENEEPIFTPVIEEKEEDIITLYNEEKEDEESSEESFEIKAEDIKIEEENEVEPTEEVKDNNLIEFFKSLNVEIDSIEESVTNILNNTDKDLIKKNIEQLKAIDFTNDELFTKVDNYMYLTDKELSQKINFLRSKGVNDKNIRKEFVSGNLIYDLETLQSKFETLKNNNIDISDNNLSILELNVANYFDNIEKLNKAGIELDEKESRNYKEVLSVINHIDEDTEILKNYLIKIVRKNGKYAVDALWNNPIELSMSIDSLLENDLEKLIESNPEVLGKNAETILKVVKYCEDNNIPVFDEDNQNVFYKYIYDYEEFRKLFAQAELPKVISHKDNNDSIISNIKNDMTRKLIETLDENYSKDKFNTINLDPTTNDKYSKIITNALDTLKAEQVSGNIYKMNNLLVSKNKLERNVKIIVDVLAKDGESLEGLEKNILLIAALYNQRLTNDVIKNTVNDIIGFIG